MEDRLCSIKDGCGYCLQGRAWAPAMAPAVMPWFDGELLYRDTVRRRLLISFDDMDERRPCYVPIDRVELELLEPGRYPGWEGDYGPCRVLLPDGYRRVTAVDELMEVRMRAKPRGKAARATRVYRGPVAQEPVRLYPNHKEPLGLFDDLPKQRK